MCDFHGVAISKWCAQCPGVWRGKKSCPHYKKDIDENNGYKRNRSRERKRDQEVSLKYPTKQQKTGVGRGLTTPAMPALFPAASHPLSISWPPIMKPPQTSMKWMPSASLPHSPFISEMPPPKQPSSTPQVQVKSTPSQTTQQQPHANQPPAGLPPTPLQSKPIHQPTALFPPPTFHSQSIHQAPMAAIQSQSLHQPSMLLPSMVPLSLVSSMVPPSRQPTSTPTPELMQRPFSREGEKGGEVSQPPPALAHPSNTLQPSSGSLSTNAPPASMRIHSSMPLKMMVLPTSSLLITPVAKRPQPSNMPLLPPTMPLSTDCTRKPVAKKPCEASELVEHKPDGLQTQGGWSEWQSDTPSTAEKVRELLFRVWCGVEREQLGMRQWMCTACNVLGGKGASK